MVVRNTHTHTHTHTQGPARGRRGPLWPALPVCVWVCVCVCVNDGVIGGGINHDGGVGGGGVQVRCRNTPTRIYGRRPAPCTCTSTSAASSRAKVTNCSSPAPNCVSPNTPRYRFFFFSRFFSLLKFFCSWLGGWVGGEGGVLLPHSASFDFS